MASFRAQFHLSVKARANASKTERWAKRDTNLGTEPSVARISVKSQPTTKMEMSKVKSVLILFLSRIRSNKSTSRSEITAPSIGAIEISRTSSSKGPQPSNVNVVNGHYEKEKSSYKLEPFLQDRIACES